MDITQVFEKINKWGFSSKAKIKKILNMSRRNYISVNVVNKVPIREDGRNKRDQTSK